MPIIFFKFQQGVFIYYIISYSPVTYGTDYVYPKWAEIMGLCISFSSMMWVIVYAIYYLITTPGTLKERWIAGITPVFDKKEDFKEIREEVERLVVDPTVESLVEPNTIA